VFRWITDLVSHFGYGEVGLLMFLENVFAPIGARGAHTDLSAGRHRGHASSLFFTIVGTALWTAALTYAGYLLGA
jgi:membrane protein DedA with SNARE-associated domain